MSTDAKSGTRGNYWRATHYYRRLEKHVITTRRTKAARIAQVLSEAVDLNTSRILDLGCSVGLITESLSRAASEVVGIDVDVDAIHLAKKTACTFVAADTLRLPFQNGIFDAVVCNQVLEYVPDKRLAISEIRRVLRKNGVCYLAATNRANPIDPHHGLPFLSWLPRSVAHRYLRLTGRGNYYYESSMDYFQMKNLMAGFRMKDYTILALKNPSRYGVTYEVGRLTSRVLNALPSRLLRMLLFLSPGWLIVLQKI